MIGETIDDTMAGKLYRLQNKTSDFCLNCGRYLLFLICNRNGEWKWVKTSLHGRAFCSISCEDSFCALFSQGRAFQRIKKIHKACFHCGTKGTLEIHHLTQILSAKRRMDDFNILNVPCNLIPLCHKCHVGIYHSVRVTNDVDS